jgi:DNA polymerase III alpha subunit
VNLLPLKTDEADHRHAVSDESRGRSRLAEDGFLGLKTLTVLRNTVEMVKRTQGVTSCSMICRSMTRRLTTC